MFTSNKNFPFESDLNKPLIESDNQTEFSHYDGEISSACQTEDSRRPNIMHAENILTFDCDLQVDRTEHSVAY